MYRSKETLQQAPQNKRKESYGPGPTKLKDKTTLARVPNAIPLAGWAAGQGGDTGGVPV